MQYLNLHMEAEFVWSSVSSALCIFMMLRVAHYYEYCQVQLLVFQASLSKRSHVAASFATKSEKRGRVLCEGDPL